MRERRSVAHPPVTSYAKTFGIKLALGNSRWRLSVRPVKSTCSRLLKHCEDLTEAERHDLAEVLSRWARSEEHARRVVLELPARPTAIDIRKAAARVRPVTSLRRPVQGCPRCFGSGF